MSTLFPHRPFYFLRHGQTDWNLEGRMQGHTDIPLNATGLQQAQAAALKLKHLPITHIVTSPLSRALKTAAIAAETLGLPLHIDSNLKERTFGSLEGSLRRDLMLQHNIAEHEPYDRILPEDAEQWPATLSRAQAGIMQWLNAHPAETILFVGHGAFLRALHEALTSEYFEAANATPYH
ncbi:MAG: histidine phosphatase family protein, partial [Alphaproteobacteria bacterium]